MLEFLSNPQIWASLVTLTALEIVLGVDNLVFISVITSKLPAEKQKHARRFGLLLACITRLLLLGAITGLTKFTQPIFTLFGQSFSCRDLVMLAGGLFLLAKSTSEIHVDVAQQTYKFKFARAMSFTVVIIQIMLLDIIFSLDSVITAVGMTQEFMVMAAAIIIAVLLMLFATEPLNRFIQTYPTLKMLALSFLLLVGVVLIADGLEFHVPRGYLYFAIAFSIFVEILNIVAGRRAKNAQNKM